MADGDIMITSTTTCFFILPVLMLGDGTAILFGSTGERWLFTTIPSLPRFSSVIGHPSRTRTAHTVISIHFGGAIGMIPGALTGLGLGTAIGIRGGLGAIGDTPGGGGGRLSS